MTDFLIIDVHATATNAQTRDFNVNKFFSGWHLSFTQTTHSANKWEACTLRREGECRVVMIVVE